MKKPILSLFMLSYAVLLISYSCNSGINQKSEGPYEIMSVAFEGNPQEGEIKPMVEAVMEKYNFPITDENCLKVGSGLVVNLTK